MAFINLEVKYWKKYFTKKERKKISNLFKSITDIKDWDKVEYEELDKKLYFNYYPRLETDIEDNIEGIKANQLKQYLKKYDFKGLQEILLYLKNPSKKYIEDGFVNWKKAWKQEIVELNMGGKKVIEQIKEILNLPKPLNFISTPEILSEIKNEKLIFSNILDNIEEWKANHKSLPKRDIITIYCNGSSFNMKTFSSFKRKVEAKKKIGFFDLSFETQKAYLKLYNLFGDQIDYVEEEMGSVDQKKIDEIEILISQIENKLPEVDMDKILPYAFQKSVQSIKTANYELESITKLDTEQINVNMARIIETAFKYEPYPHIANMLDTIVWSSIVTTIPDINITIDSGWSCKTVKDDPVVTVLGYITNCCMHFGGVGEACIRYGVRKHNSSFLIFYNKRQKVVGFVFLWEFTHKGERVLVYDSVEILGKDISISSPMKLVLESVKAFYKHYDKIICGYDGQYSPKGLKKQGELIQDSSLKVCALDEAAKIGYSDIKDGIILFPKEGDEDENHSL